MINSFRNCTFPHNFKGLFIKQKINCIYKIDCASSNKGYIGRTKKHLSEKIKKRERLVLCRRGLTA